MDGIASGPVLVGNYELFLAVRQLLIHLCWLLAAALAGVGACWCCGYGAQAAWARAEATRHAWRGTGRADPVEDVVSAEAMLGIREIEEYLAVRSVGLPRPDRVDRDEPG